MKVFQSMAQVYSGKKFRVLPTGVEPMTFRLLVQLLYIPLSYRRLVVAMSLNPSMLLGFECR